MYVRITNVCFSCNTYFVKEPQVKNIFYRFYLISRDFQKHVKYSGHDLYYVSILSIVSVNRDTHFPVFNICYLIKPSPLKNTKNGRKSKDTRSFTLDMNINLSPTPDL